MIQENRGFTRHELRNRYDVPVIQDDEWHAYSGERTAACIAHHLPPQHANSEWLVNAGAGVFELRFGAWRELSVDLFINPIMAHQYPVCASVECLPFRSQTIGAVVCVGEVLGYCDPARAIGEIARILVRSGMFIFDFASSRSIRYMFRATYGRAADLITGIYNGLPERIWVYDPRYIQELLVSSGFIIQASLGTHTWSVIAQRLGLPTAAAASLQRHLDWLPLPARSADLMTIVAMRGAAFP